MSALLANRYWRLFCKIAPNSRTTSIPLRWAINTLCTELKFLMLTKRLTQSFTPALLCSSYWLVGSAYSRSDFRCLLFNKRTFVLFFDFLLQCSSSFALYYCCCWSLFVVFQLAVALVSLHEEQHALFSHAMQRDWLWGLFLALAVVVHFYEQF